MIPAAATGASTTTSTAAPTQPTLPHPPPHQVSRDSSSSRSSRSRNRSSNLNSSPSSSSSRRRPRGVGFSSQAWPTSAGWLAAVGGAEVDVEAPTRGTAAPGEAVSDSLGSANRQSRQQKEGGGQNELVPCSQTQRGPWDLVGAPKPVSVSPALFHGEKERLNRNCSTDSRSWFNRQMPYDVLPQNATTDSREVTVSNTLHFTRPTEIQNSRALAKPAADRAIPCRKREISQQQNGGGAVSTQIGHAPGRLEDHGQTAVQCRQNEISQQQKNSSMAVLTQIGHEPSRLEDHGQTAVQCRQNEISQQQKNSSMAVLTQIGHEPSRLEAQGQTAVQCRQNENLQEQNSNGTVPTQLGYAPSRACRAIRRSSRTVA